MRLFVGLLLALSLASAKAEPLDYNVSGLVVYYAQSHLGKFMGTNEAIGGVLSWDPQSKQVKGQICVDLKEWKSGIASRDDHTATMFRVGRFPTACLELKKVEGDLAKGQIVLVGTLSLQGIHLPVRIPSRLVVQNRKLVIEGQFDTRISDWGMERPRMLGVEIGDWVRVRIAAEGVPVVEAHR